MGSSDWETDIQSAKTFQDIEAVFESVFPFEHAKYDYAQNGTKAKKFKEWFGDWEKGENVSKVVNEDGSPKETHEIKMPSIVYHGTANAGFQKFDPEYFDDDALFGPGFYFTENEDVATDYMIKGDPPRIVEGYREEFLKEFLSQIDGLLPIQERHQKSFLNTGDIKWLTRVHFGKVETGKIKAISKSMKGRVSEDSRMAVYRCYLNIRNPFDGDKDFVNGRFLPENMQRYVDGPKSAFGYQSLVEMYKTDRKQVNEFLQSIGYDGITHIGGNVSDGTKHRVWIAFNPKQIKHVNNQGTFQPDSDNILESAATDMNHVRSRINNAVSFQDINDLFRDEFRVSVNFAILQQAERLQTFIADYRNEAIPNFERIEAHDKIWMLSGGVLNNAWEMEAAGIDKNDLGNILNGVDQNLLNAALHETRETGAEIRKMVANKMQEMAETRKYLETKYYDFLKEHGLDIAMGNKELSDAAKQILKDVENKPQQIFDEMLESLCETSNISQKEAEEWVEKFVKIPASARQKLNRPNPPYAPYTVEKAKKDIALFYRMTGGRIPVLNFEAKRGKRSSASWHTIHIAGDDFCRRTLWHEMGHILEHSSSAISRLSSHWLKSRIKQPPTVKSLRELTKNKGFDSDEVAFIDGFFDPYVGKKYGHGSTEVISMGLQQLWREHDVNVILGKTQKSGDIDHLDFVLGLAAMPMSDDANLIRANVQAMEIEERKKQKEVDKFYSAVDREIKALGGEKALMTGGHNTIIKNYGRGGGYGVYAFLYSYYNKSQSWGGFQTRAQALRALYFAVLIDQMGGFEWETLQRVIDAIYGNYIPHQITSFESLPKIDPTKIKGPHDAASY